MPMINLKDLSNEQLENALAKALKMLIDNNLLPGNIDTKKLIENVMTNIRSGQGEKLTVSTLQNNNFTKMLAVMLVGQFVNDHNKDFKLDYVKLLKDLPRLTNEEKLALKDDLVKTLQLHLEKIDLQLNKANPTPKLKMQAFAKQLAESILGENTGKDNALDNEAGVKLLVALTLSAKELTYLSLYGGVDPSKAGGIQATVNQLQGNQLGFAKEDNVVQISGSLMDEINRFDTDRPDPLGLENIAFAAELALGPICGVILQELQSEGLAPSNAPGLKPPFG